MVLYKISQCTTPSCKSCNIYCKLYSIISIYKTSIAPNTPQRQLSMMKIPLLCVLVKIKPICKKKRKKKKNIILLPIATKRGWAWPTAAIRMQTILPYTQHPEQLRILSYMYKKNTLRKVYTDVYTYMLRTWIMNKLVSDTAISF